MSAHQAVPWGKRMPVTCILGNSRFQMLLVGTGNTEFSHAGHHLASQRISGVSPSRMTA